MGMHTYTMVRHSPVARVRQGRTSGPGRRYPISRPGLAARPYQAHRVGARRSALADFLELAANVGVLLLMFAAILYGLPVLAAVLVP